MFPPRLDTSSVSNSSYATLVDAFRESVFSDTSDVLFSSHAHRINEASRVPTSAYSIVSMTDGQSNTLIPYVNQPVNHRESNSYRRHGNSAHFVIAPTNIPRSSAQNAGAYPGATYLTPYVSANPYLNVHPSRRGSVSYRNADAASQYDLKKQNALKNTLGALEGLSPRSIRSAPVGKDAIPSGLVGPSMDEGHPIHPPVYPHTVAPASSYEYSGDRDGFWEVDEPVVLRRQERTRTIKATYIPEVVRIDEAYEEESAGSPDAKFYARLPARTKDGDSPHPNATHFFPTRGQVDSFAGYKCKVRRYDKKKVRHSDWYDGVIEQAYILQPIRGKDGSYYKVAFENPILGPQSEFFFLERNEITFNVSG